MYKCKKCKKGFERKYDRDRHFKKGVCVSIDDMFEKINETQQYNICPKCEKKYKHKKRLLNHLEKCVDTTKTKNSTQPQIINNINYNYNIDNSVTNNVDNSQNLILNVQIVNKGEENVEHITTEKILKIMNNSFPDVLSELMRLMYFNKEVPENQSWCVLYPNEKYGALQYNNETDLVERLLTDKTVNFHFENMVHTLSPIIDDIVNDEEIKQDLTNQQKRNLSIFFNFFGLSDLSDDKPSEYEHLKMMAYNNKLIPMEMWKQIGLRGVFK